MKIITGEILKQIEDLVLQYEDIDNIDSYNYAEYSYEIFCKILSL